jgi:hypothetical protein
MTANPLNQAYLKPLPSTATAQPHLLSSTQEVVIGRDPSCQIVLDEETAGIVSRRHASIRPGAQPNHYEICDLGSANGTYINDKRLQGCLKLETGDRITLGINGPSFQFELSSVAPTAIGSKEATATTNSPTPTAAQSHAPSTIQNNPKPGGFTLTRNFLASRKAVQLGLSGAVGGWLITLVGELFWHSRPSDSLIATMVSTGIWFALISAGIAVAIAIGYQYYINRRVRVAKAIREVALFAAVAGAVSGAIAQGIFAGFGAGELLRVICWGLAGGLLGMALSGKLPSLDRMRGLLGGALGGVLGGIIFILLSYTLSDTFGRLFGCAAIGFCIGLMLIVVDTLFSKAWLVIDYDDGSTRTLNIGKEPITVGSDEALSIVSVRNAPPVALRFTLEQGQIIGEDIAAGTKTNLRPGYTKRVGNCTITVGAVS